MADEIGKVLIKKDEIRLSVKNIAENIIKDYPDKNNFLFVTVLKGAKYFANDLINEIRKLKDVKIRNEFIKISSYKGTETTGKIKVEKDVEIDLFSKDVFVVDGIIDYIEHHSRKWLSEKTVKREIGNRNDSKKLYPIPDWRVKIYAKWLHEKVGKDREWIAKWLEYTAYSFPGDLLAEISDISGDIHKVYHAVKTNVPPLRNRL